MNIDLKSFKIINMRLKNRFMQVIQVRTSRISAQFDV